ncbi:MAG: hypothetical protein NW208_02590 [Bryobacter sp.]|nr:hypothetical protein [Bryobacter sp.]
MLAIAAATETFSYFHVLEFWPVLLVWLGLAGFAVWRLRGVEFRLESDGVVQVCLAVCAGLWTLEGIAALASAPNSSDAMAYHMPRVVYWIQHKSVENYATEYLNQIMLQPLAEYVVLHLQLLTGGDRLANLGAWLATGGSMLAASLVAEKMGAGVHGQALAAVLVATIPNGVLQASGVKNEALLSFLLLAALYFALAKRSLALSVAVGLSCLTKGTAYLFAGPLVLFFAPRAVPAVALGVLLVNGPFFTRNIELSGSPLGFSSASADGKYVWKNEPISVRGAGSNLVRHVADQMGERSEAWNQWVYWKVEGLHKRLGWSLDDPCCTWPYTKFAPPKNTSHEADRNNRWHFVLALLAAVYFVWKREFAPAALLVAAGLGVLAVAGYLKWQPFMGRMFLPLFALACVPVALWVGRWKWPLQIVLILFLADHVRLMALQNATRPLRGEKSLFLQAREDTYFNDMVTWEVNDVYKKAIAEVAATGCKMVAVDITWFQLEYPLQAQLLARDKGYRFVHVNTKNPSRKYERRWKDLEPCVLVCLACDRWVEPLAD